MAVPKLTYAFLNRTAVSPHLPLPQTAISEKVKQTVLVLRFTNDFMSSLLIPTLDLPTSRSLITDLMFGWCGLMSAMCPSP